MRSLEVRDGYCGDLPGVEAGAPALQVGGLYSQLPLHNGYAAALDLLGRRRPEMQGMSPLGADFVFRNEAGEMADNGVSVPARDNLAHRFEPIVHQLGVDGRTRLEDLDLFVVRRQDVLTLGDQLLEQLLSRAEAGEFDLDVLAGHQSREADH